MTIYHTQLARLRISGSQVSTFLQGQLTQDVTHVDASSLTYTGMCDNKGRVLADGYLIKDQSDYFLVLHQTLSDMICMRLQKYARLSGCEVQIDPQSVYGCDTVSTSGYQICEGLSLCFQINSDESGIASTASWNLREIIAGIPRIEARTSGKFTAHMLGLDKLNAISLKKGCYVGQEIIARTHYRGKNKRHCYRMLLEDSYEPGDSIKTDKGTAHVLRQQKHITLLIG